VFTLGVVISKNKKIKSKGKLCKIFRLTILKLVNISYLLVPLFHMCISNAKVLGEILSFVNGFFVDLL